MKAGPEFWLALSVGLLIGAVDKTAFPSSGAVILWSLGIGFGLGGAIGALLLRRKERQERSRTAGIHGEQDEASAI